MVRAVIREELIDQEAEKLSKVLKRISKEDIKMVLNTMIANRQNNKRQPKPPPPEGGITLSEAERKYGIPNPTTSRWVSKGYIPVLKRTDRELYIDESALIKLLEAYKQNPGRGKWTIKQQLNG